MQVGSLNSFISNGKTAIGFLQIRSVKLTSTGFTHVANFDLTSFYDSIDHHVLRHFLVEVGIDEELIEFTTNCLHIWTSSTWSNRSNIIYLRHGIPQGPLSSGMLSEVVLMHIDEAGERRTDALSPVC